MHKYIVVLGFLLTTLSTAAQDFAPSAPLDIPLVLSGTFAELRSNHFHGGIDIKTQGRSGLKVKAVADGYVSRVAVSPYGYGNALYVRHPEGYTTVYAHLNAFAPEIEAWVENTLRDRSKNDGNLYPNADQFPVSRGEMIAFSGNTGGSMGPHLHFEIRDTRTEEPLNPLEFGIVVKDTRKPDIRGLMWTQKGIAERQKFNSGDTIEAYSAIAFDLFTTDKQDLANNNNGVYKIVATANGQTFFTAHYHRINFNTTRFINAHVNFEQYFKEGVRYTRLYTLENNPLELTESPALTTAAFSTAKGWFSVAKDSLVQVDVRIEDYANNTSDLRFFIRGGDPVLMELPSDRLRWDADNALEIGPVKVNVPEGALYQDTYFPLKKMREGEYLIGGGSIALQKHMELRWELDSVQERGVGWFAWELGRNGKKDAITGEREGNTLVLKTRSTGTYYLDQDVQKPSVRLVQSTPMVRSGSVFMEYRIHAEDDKTGIDRYSARIDDAFARIDFDYKRNLLKVVIPQGIGPGSHNLRVVIIDAVGNTTTADYTVTL